LSNTGIFGTKNLEAENVCSGIRSPLSSTADVLDGVIIPDFLEKSGVFFCEKKMGRFSVRNDRTRKGKI
jgi:hypothetical protein